MIQTFEIQEVQVILIENNGSRTTFLDTVGCPVYYTNNNSIVTENKGIKEYQDIMDCIRHYNISDTDFIVKMTGRYILQDDCDFMKIVKNLHTTPYDCIIKYGSYQNPSLTQVEDCITGLIGMKCFYIKHIEKPKENECVEWKWAKATYLIHPSKIRSLSQLGIAICPGSNDYFLV
jgi:hypothetical protein